MMKKRGPIVITGFMGCGKSRVARELARRLNASMVDLDEYISKREGRSPAQLIRDQGEPAFRSIESDALRDLLQRSAAGVIALGGGAWIEETNRNLINQHSCLSVWLDAPFQLCWSRIEASAEDRPLGRTRNQALALYECRRPVYQLANTHVQILANENFDDLISRIENKLNRN